jgi:hypothetical protein
MPEPLRVCVELDPGGDAIAGTLWTGQGQQPFTGWLGLISGLENAITGWHQHTAGAGFAGAGESAPSASEVSGGSAR